MRWIGGLLAVLAVAGCAGLPVEPGGGGVVTNDVPVVEEPVVVDQPGVSNTWEFVFEPEPVYVGDKEYYKGVGLRHTQYGWMLTECNVYGPGSDRSRIILNWDKEHPVYQGPEETLGQPALWYDQVVFPNEHGRYVVVYEHGHVLRAPRAPEKWFLVADAIDGGRTPIGFCTGEYVGIFQKEAVVFDVWSGAVLQKIPAKTLVRSTADCWGKKWYAGNFGENVFGSIEDGVVMRDSPVLTLCSLVDPHTGQERLLGAGSVLAGPAPGNGDGRVYEWRREEGRWVELYDTGSTSCPRAWADEHHAFFAFADNDLLLAYDGRDFVVVHRFGRNTHVDGEQDFGAGGDSRGDVIMWMRTRGRRSDADARVEVYRVLRKNRATRD